MLLPAGDLSSWQLCPGELAGVLPPPPLPPRLQAPRMGGWANPSGKHQKNHHCVGGSAFVKANISLHVGQETGTFDKIGRADTWPEQWRSPPGYQFCSVCSHCQQIGRLPGKCALSSIDRVLVNSPGHCRISPAVGAGIAALEGVSLILSLEAHVWASKIRNVP